MQRQRLRFLEQLGTGFQLRLKSQLWDYVGVLIPSTQAHGALFALCGSLPRFSVKLKTAMPVAGHGGQMKAVNHRERSDQSCQENLSSVRPGPVIVCAGFLFFDNGAVSYTHLTLPTICSV